MYNSIEQIKVFYPLITWENNEILRKKSEKVDIFDDEIKEFSEILLDLMYAYDWVGLAAPQVGKNIRIIATTQWKEVKKWRKNSREIIWETAMINPEILEHSEEKKNDMQLIDILFSKKLIQKIFKHILKIKTKNNIFSHISYRNLEIKE